MDAKQGREMDAGIAPLRSNYDCYGDFYSRGIHECRKSLDIILRGTNITKPDFMVLMMNPGGSRPATGQPKHGRVRAEPDDTQHQIMKLMNHARFEFARILNLSDIREPKSKKFREKLAQAGKDQTHSIFDSSRNCEFDRLYVHGAPVLLAWGVHKDLEPLARLALAATVGEDARGLKKEGDSWSYYHPLPPLQANRRKWLADIESQF